MQEWNAGVTSRASQTVDFVDMSGILYSIVLYSPIHAHNDGPSGNREVETRPSFHAIQSTVAPPPSLITPAPH